jgi:hypothetical protein
MNWMRFAVLGIVAVVLGVLASTVAMALFPELPLWAVTVIGGAVTGLCAPAVVSRGRQGSDKRSLTREPKDEEGG